MNSFKTGDYVQVSGTGTIFDSRLNYGQTYRVVQTHGGFGKQLISIKATSNTESEAPNIWFWSNSFQLVFLNSNRCGDLIYKSVGDQIFAPKSQPPTASQILLKLYQGHSLEWTNDEILEVASVLRETKG